jgi:hypothetical protein
MDPVLSSLFPINQIGSDGFNWWVGQIETNKNDDPKKSGRYRVRIVGQHLKDCDSTPTNELPWANVMMPVTAPFTDGLTSGASIGLEQGNWVVGFYMDSDKQKPIIMGSVGHTKASTIIKNTDPTPGKSCKSFTTYISNDVNPKTDWPSANQTGTNKDKANVVSASEPAATYGYIPGQVPPVISSLLGKRSETNPTGAKHKYIIADPKCGSDGNLKSGITRIIADLLKANQDAGGRLGDYLVSKSNGQLYNYVGISRYHIGRVTRLVSSFIARVKGEIIKLLRQGIQKLIDALILFDDPSGKIIGNTGPLKDPEKAFKPIREKGNRLKKIKEIFDKIFADLGCTIADATDKISKWLFDLLFGFLSDVFYQASCFVDTLVEGIINQILSVLESLIGTVLGPIQQLLSVLANPLNIIGGAINRVLSLLGISCSGPGAKCEKIQEVSVTCEEDDTDDKDFLDKLIKDIEKGPLDTKRGVCDEAKGLPPEEQTVVVFVGGVFADSPATVISTPPGGPNTPPSFFPEPFDPEDTIPGSDPPPELPVPTPAIPDEPVDPPSPEETEEPYYEVSTDKNVYTEGEVITYTIKTLNVPNNTVLNYELSGPEIVEENIVDGLTGSFVVTNNSSVVTVTIADEGVVEDVPKLLNFSIVNTAAQASVVIDSNYVLVPGIDDDVTLEPAYAVTSDKLTYIEGENIIYTITTENIDDNTVLSYTLFGNNITSNDILGGNLGGTFIVIDNTAQVVIRLAETLEKKNNEVLTFVINGTGASTDVTILKSPQTREEEEKDREEDREEDIPEPKINKPVADTPITDENGSIISIPVISPGDSYQKEPNVIIGGNGYGATAIALLDDNGFVSEIRVTRSGVNYKRNTAKDVGLSCVVDSYTLITPGVGYTSPPEVYVNGDNTIAEALINEDGFVYGVRVLDRSKTYDKLPKVDIIGGGGAGARVIANITCLDIEELERRGYAKVGTGKYIDCP